MATRLFTKKDVLLAFLERGVAMVHLDARREGVAVPQQHAQDPHLRLNLSYRYRIPDFEVDDAGVRATLSFGGRAFHCVLPWEAIFGVTSAASGDGQVWPEDLPAEVVSAARDEQDEPPPAEPRVRLASVSEPPDEPEEAASPAPGGRSRGHLRLVR